MSREIRKAEAAALLQLFVDAESMTLLVRLADGSDLQLAVPKGLDAEFVHIIADGLQQRQRKEFDPKAGHLLVHSRVWPARAETRLTELGLQEKLVLEIGSEGATRITHRLSEESVRNWIDTMERLLVSRKSKRTLSS